MAKSGHRGEGRTSPAGDDRVAAIRDILFGEHAAAAEDRMAALEARLDESVRKLESAAEAQEAKEAAALARHAELERRLADLKRGDKELAALLRRAAERLEQEPS